MTLTEPVEEWIPQLLEDTWSQAVDQLLSEGTDVVHKNPPAHVVGAKHQQSGGSIQGTDRLKVYQAGEQTSEPQTIGDTDRDRVMTVVIDYQVKAGSAPDMADSAQKVIDRVLNLHRKHPHPDWDRFESWTDNRPETYPDYQHLTFTVRLAKRGELLPTPIVDQT